MTTLATACDHLDEADARLALITDMLTVATGDLTLTQTGMIGLVAFLRDVTDRIGTARSVIDSCR